MARARHAPHCSGSPKTPPHDPTRCAASRHPRPAVCSGPDAPRTRRHGPGHRVADRPRPRAAGGAAARPACPPRTRRPGGTHRGHGGRAAAHAGAGGADRPVRTQRGGRPAWRPCGPHHRLAGRARRTADLPRRRHAVPLADARRPSRLRARHPHRHRTGHRRGPRPAPRPAAWQRRLHLPARGRDLPRRQGHAGPRPAHRAAHRRDLRRACDGTAGRPDRRAARRDVRLPTAHPHRAEGRPDGRRDRAARRAGARRAGAQPATGQAVGDPAHRRAGRRPDIGDHGLPGLPDRRPAAADAHGRGAR